MVLHITFQSEAWRLSDGVSAGFIGFDPPTRPTICTNSDWIQRFIFYFSPSPLWPRSKGDGDHTAGWKCPKWPLLSIPINPWTSFAVTLVPSRFHTSPPTPFPASPSLGVWYPPASLAHFVLTLNTVISEYTLCLSTLLLNIGFFFFFAAFLVSKHVVSNLKLWRERFKKIKK